MSDKLKEHIEFKRDELDIYPFDVDKGWSEIVGDITKSNKQVRRRLWVTVAASIIMLMVGWLGIDLLSSTSGSFYSSDFEETQFYYQDMIDAKLHLVMDRVDDPELLADIKALDKAFIELRQDLQDDVQNEEVVMAMIDNYRLKLKILERILEDLDENSDEENTNI